MDILILPGWLLPQSRYKNFVSNLQGNGVRILAPELPGFEKFAPLLKPYKLDDYVEYLISFLDSNKIDKVVVIGHSFGGRLAMKLAVRCPERISQIILSGVPVYQMDHRVRRLFKIVARAGNTVFSLPGLKRLQPFARKILYRFTGSYDYMKTAGHIRETFKNCVDEKIVELLPLITKPTLILWGKDDVITPLAVAQKLHKELPQSALCVIPHAGHNVLIDNSENAVREIINFLSIPYGIVK